MKFHNDPRFFTERLFKVISRTVHACPSFTFFFVPFIV